MKRYAYLGVNGNNCCIISSLSTFDEIEKSKDNWKEFKANAWFFNYDSTNWNGHDTIERTCKIKSFKITGRKVILPHLLEVWGSDFDMGHEYNWRFTYNEIWEVEVVGDYIKRLKRSEDNLK